MRTGGNFDGGGGEGGGGDESIEFQKELKVEKVSNMIVTSTETVSMDNLINIKKFSHFNEIISNNKVMWCDSCKI